MEALFDTLPVGAHHVRDWLTLEQQRWIVGEFQRWARGPVPPHSPRVRGHAMSVQMLCLGWHWRPYRYERRASDVNGRAVPPVPEWMVRVGRRALASVADPTLPAPDDFTPDVAVVNFYGPGAKMGLHQDREERSGAPVVSLSVGDTARFRFGNTRARTRPWTDLDLASGDLFVFGGPARLAHHGVLGTRPGTGPDVGLPPGRLNITLRETGLTG